MFKENCEIRGNFMSSMKKLLQYIKPYTLFALLGPLLMCIEVAMDLLQPTIMQIIIDKGIANQDNPYVIKLGFLMLLSAVIGLIGGAGSSIFAAKASVNFSTDIRRDLFKKIERFSNQNTDSFGSGKLITIVTNDITTIQSALIMTLRVFVRGPLLIHWVSYYCLANGSRTISNLTSCDSIFDDQYLFLFEKIRGTLWKSTKSDG